LNVHLITVSQGWRIAPEPMNFYSSGRIGTYVSGQGAGPQV
jgi:hypothetical protein